MCKPTSNTQPRTKLPALREEASSPAMLSVVSGTTCGVSGVGVRRRGSFLVLVVGTLAVLAVVTVIFVALGNQDSRTRSAIVERERLDTVPKQMGDYIANEVIARDVFDLTMDGMVTGTGAPVFRRETTDAPVTVWPSPPDGPLFNALTVPPGASPALDALTTFTPTGGIDASRTAIFAAPGAALVQGGRPVIVPPSDPFLASIRPTYLEDPSFTGPAAGTGIFSRFASRDVERPYLYKLDWAQVSNVAPDGAFINLFNLRNNFDATPEEMRAGLSLYDPETGAPGFTDLDFGAPADANVPAHWNTRQVMAFRPARVGADEASLLGVTTPFESPDFKGYQWVDADGDGMLDSRLFEMVEDRDDDASTRGRSLLDADAGTRYFFGVRIIDLSGLVNVNTAGDITRPSTQDFPPGLTPADVDLRRLLTQVDSYARYNAEQDAAPRSGGYEGIDSADVTGTAADYTVMTESQAWNSGTKAYISLRFAVGRGAVPGRFDARFEDPNAGGQALPLIDGADWEDPDTETQRITDLFNPQIAGVQDPFADPDDNVGDPFFSSRAIFAPYPNPAANVNLINDVMEGINDATATPPVVPWGTMAWPARRASFYLEQALAFAGSTYGVSYAPPELSPPDLAAATVSYTFGVPIVFGMGDLEELLSRAATNNPRVTSPLEVTLGARDASGEYAAASIDLDPLRSNRPLSVELSTYDDNDDITPDPGSQRDATLLRLATDVRSLLTTVNGSRPLRTLATPLNVANATVSLGVEELRIDAREALDDESTLDPTDPGALTRGPARLFQGYAEALAGATFLGPDVWDPTAAGFDANRTLFYGYQGPELAVLTAAHMAVNMTDMADSHKRRTPDAARDPSLLTSTTTSDFLDQGYLTPGQPERPGVFDPINTPTVRTVILNNADINSGVINGTVRDTLEDAEDADAAGLPWWEGGTPAGQPSPNFDLGDARIAADEDHTVVPAVNVIGIEPQVFLTQVTTVSAYVDLDTTSTSTAVVFDVSDDPAQGATTNSGEVLFRMVAFKLTNPFGQPVALSNSSIYSSVPETPGNIPSPDARLIEVNELTERVDQMRDFSYIRFGDRNFLLMSYEQQTYTSTPVPNEPSLSPGSSPGFFENEFVNGSSNPDVAPTILRQIIVPPGQTIMVYGLSEAPSKILARLRSLPGLRALTPGDVDDVFMTDINGLPLSLDRKELIDRILTANLARDISGYTFDPVNGVAAAYWVPMFHDGEDTTTPPGFDPATGLQGTNTFVSPIPAIAGDYTGAAPAFTAIQHEPRTVTLWRALRSSRTGVSDPALPQGEFTAVAGNASGASDWAGASSFALPNDVWTRNIYTNDQLWDRFRLPIGVNFSTRNFVDGGAVEDTDANVVGDEVTRGYTVSAFVTTRRPNDLDFPVPYTSPQSAANSLEPRSGSLPIYCIEPKYFDRVIAGLSPRAGADQRQWNVHYTTPQQAVSEHSIDRSVFLTGPSSRALTRADFADLVPGTGFALTEDSVSQPTTAGWALLSARLSSGELGIFRFSFMRQNLIAHPGNFDSWFGGYVNSDLFIRMPEERRPHAASFLSGYASNTPAYFVTGQFPTGVLRARWHAPSVHFDGGFFNLDQGGFYRDADTSEPPTPTLPSSGGAYNPRPHVRWVSTLRLADMLLPLGIGPMEAPVGSNGVLRTSGNAIPGSIANPGGTWFTYHAATTARYTTLAEAAAIALGWDTPQVGSGQEAVLPWAAFADQDPALLTSPFNASGVGYRLPTPTAPVQPGMDASQVMLFDRGNVWLDRFVPFIDANAGPGAPVLGDDPLDLPVGLRIPAAAGVLEVFSTPPKEIRPNLQRSFVGITSASGPNVPGVNRGVVLSLGSDPTSAQQARRDLTRARAGLVNINTAPPEVLRLLPLANPLPYQMPGPVNRPTRLADAGNPPPQDQRYLNVASGNAFPILDQQADVAAMLAAYRDMTSTPLNSTLRLRTNSAFPGARREFIPLPDTINNDNPFDGVRSAITATQIPGLARWPGFGSIGEVLAARARTTATSNSPLPIVPLRFAGFARFHPSQWLPWNIDALGHDIAIGQPSRPERNSSVAALAPRRSGDPGPVFSGTTPALFEPGVRNEFAEKLIVPSALSNIITTRSDVYAAWFVVLGYRESDVTGLAPTEPLTPSVRRRFLMVVDRSNVVTKGDKPRVLLFREVPAE